MGICHLWVRIKVSDIEPIFHLFTTCLRLILYRTDILVPLCSTKIILPYLFTNDHCLWISNASSKHNILLSPRVK